MRIRKLIPGRALFTEADRIWVAQGMAFFAIDYDGKRLTPKYTVGGLKEKTIARNRLSRQLLRQGIHHLLPLEDGSVFLTAKRVSYVVDAQGVARHEFTGYRGNKPGHQGVCVTPAGSILFAEYTLNMDRSGDTALWRSTNGGATFEKVLTLTGEQVRHIHFVKWDPYGKCLWLGTGDKDHESLLMRSDDEGATWKTVGGGTQDWRAIGVCFDEGHLVWGTDAGSVPDQNHIVRMDRKTCELDIVANAEGPCHGCGSFRDGRVFISTGVEGGQNEKDRFARLKQVTGTQVIDVWKCEKDPLPLIMQYGVIRFPLGTENTRQVVFTAFGLKGHGECVCIEDGNDD